jgi:hypothetical protein
MNEHEILGFTTADLVSAMLDAGIHTSVDRFRRLAAEIQRRGFAERDKRELAGTDLTCEAGDGTD